MIALMAMAAAATAAPDVTVTGDAQRSQHIVCRRVETVGASRIVRRRVCRPAAEWRAMSDSSTDDAMDTLTVVGRESLAVPGTSGSRSFGAPGAPR